MEGFKRFSHIPSLLLSKIVASLLKQWLIYANGTRPSNSDSFYYVFFTSSFKKDEFYANKQYFQSAVTAKSLNYDAIIQVTRVF